MNDRRTSDDRTPRARPAGRPPALLTGALLWAAVGAAGCASNKTTTVTAAAPRPEVRTSIGGTAAAGPSGEVIDANTGQPLSAERTLNGDPDASQLHELSGALLMYFAVHNRLPPRLQDVASMADFDEELKFSPPGSDEPYGYAPQGLYFPAHPRHIVVFDPRPTSGHRWCVMMSEPRVGQPVTMDVIPIPEVEFHAYMPPLQ